MTLGCQTNVISAFVDLASMFRENNADPLLVEEEFSSENNVANIKEGIVGAERPTFRADPKYEYNPESHILTYTYSLSSKGCLDTVHDFSLYFSYPDKINLSNLLSLEVYHLNEPAGKPVLCEQISRPMIVAWIENFHQQITRPELFKLPIFLNRHKLSYYTCIPSFTLQIKASFFVSPTVETPNFTDYVFLCYKTKALPNKNRQEIISRFTNTNTKMYYLYDAMKTLDKQLVLSGSKGSSIDLQLQEPFHRLTDLFVVLRSTKGLPTPKDRHIITKLSVYYEETLVFSFPAKMCETWLSPVNSDKIPSLTDEPSAKEGRSMPEFVMSYYLPFSTSKNLYEEYEIRPFVNTKNIGSIGLSIEFDKDQVSDGEYDIFFCYMSPTKLILNP